MSLLNLKTAIDKYDKLYIQIRFIFIIDVLLFSVCLVQYAKNMNFNSTCIVKIVFALEVDLSFNRCCREKNNILELFFE